MEIKAPCFGERIVLVHTEKKAKGSHQERTMFIGLQQHGTVKLLLHCLSFVTWCSAQEKQLRLSKGLRKSGTQCPSHLMSNVCPFPTPVGHTGPCETEALPPACCPSGNPRLITFSSNICTGGSLTHTGRYPAQVTCFWSEYFSDTKCISLCKPLHILLPLCPCRLDLSDKDSHDHCMQAKALCISI